MIIKGIATATHPCLVVALGRLRAWGTGAPRIGDLGPHYLTRVAPLGPTHETNAFRHLGPEPLR